MPPMNQTTTAETPTSQEASGPAFQRLNAKLATLRALTKRGVAKTARLQTEMAGLEARLATARQELARGEQEVQAGQQQCGQLGQELEELKPRLGYEFNLPQDASLAIVGQLGVARCRAARACRGLRAAVGSARHLGAFRHRMLAVAAGGQNTVVCTGDAVFSFGTGNSDGQLGYEAESQATPRIVTGLLAEDVVAAAASACNTLVCTAEGRAYWFGWLTDPDVQSSVPRLLGGLERVVGVAASDNHLLAWTGSGELYTWGVGIYEQLGHGSKEREAAPRLVEGLVGQQVVGANGGFSHSVACTASGRVYTFGCGVYACLGHGEGGANYQPTPRLVEGLAGSTVVAVAASSSITAAVTEAGELYTWGRSAYGALGHGRGQENAVVRLPRLVAGLAGRRVAGAAAGSDHTLAWTDSGELYSWGASSNGRLGHNSGQNEWLPRLVKGQLAGKAVIGAAAGGEYSAVMTREQLYTFGKGAIGLEGTYRRVPKEVAGLRVA